MKRAKLFALKGECAERASTTIPVKYAAFSENIDYSGGYLAPAPRESIYKQNGREIPVPPLCTDKLFFYSGEKGKSAYLLTLDCDEPYYCELSGARRWQKLDGVENLYDACEYAYKGRNVCVGAAYNKLFMFDGKQIIAETESSNLPAFFNAVVAHQGRLFAYADGSNAFRMYFSDEDDPLNWNISPTEGGYIDFDPDNGGLIKLISLNEFLIAITDRGLYKVVAYAEQSDFTVRKMDVRVGNIYADSIVKCGGNIVMTSSIGVLIFDGYTVRNLFPELANLRGTITACVSAACVEYRYYLCINDRLLTVDTLKGEYYFTGLKNPSAIAAYRTNDKTGIALNSNIANSKVAPQEYMTSIVCFEQNKDYYDMKLRNTGVIRTGIIDFGCPSLRKALLRLTFAKNLRGRLTVNCGKDSKHFFLTDKGFINIDMSGYEFTFKLEITTPEYRCPSPELEYRVL